MTFRLTILCENNVGLLSGVIGEHGFSCFLETPSGNYLFDTGQGYAIAHNAAVLKKDLATIRSVMLSHGHYDHAGGLVPVLRARGPVDIHGHPDMFSERYWSDESTRRFVGIPYRREILESMGARFRLNTEMVEVGPSLFLTGEIPRRTPFEKVDPNLRVARPGEKTLHPDPILDDLSLIIDSPAGLILVLGCAHSGMINIIEYALSRLNRKRIYAIVGGTHLGSAGDAQFEKTVEALQTYRIEKLGACHCTGLSRAARLQSRIGEKFFFGTVGTVLEF